MRKLLTALGLFMPLMISTTIFAADVANEAVIDASEVGHALNHESQGVPMTVGWQAINFILYIVLLVYFLKKPVVSFFTEREQKYRQALVHGERARKEAELKKREIQQRLNELEGSAEQALTDARQEADALMMQLQKDAQDTATRLREEAARTAIMSIEKAKSEIRAEILTQALDSSRKMLEEKIQEGDQKRLQTEFVVKIQEVRS
jgi:F-type H+-transporting ATPase subunit b